MQIPALGPILVHIDKLERRVFLEEGEGVAGCGIPVYWRIQFVSSLSGNLDNLDNLFQY
jgi:hypothetical protein